MLKGKIIKGIGGFYYVKAAGKIYECKARGNFKKNNTMLFAGDNVIISTSGATDNRIEDVEERKNYLRRPSVANIDLLFIVSSTVSPSINPYLIDKMTAIAEYKQIDSVIVFTKSDLADRYIEYVEIYKKAGFRTIVCNNLSGEGSDEVANLIESKTCVLAGNTGVGKSSLLNSICPEFNVETGDTSKKLGRGKHTTRQNCLYEFAGGYIVDTPGFSSLEDFETIYKEDLPYCFREFLPYIGTCQFATCSHTSEKGCSICDAVKRNEIPVSRHKSYVQMYNEVKDIEKWRQKKKSVQ